MRSDSLWGNIRINTVLKNLNQTPSYDEEFDKISKKFGKIMKSLLKKQLPFAKYRPLIKKKKGWWITLLECEPLPKARMEFIESPLNKMDKEWRKKLDNMPFNKFIKEFNKQQARKKCIDILAEMDKLPECIDRDKVIQLFRETYNLIPKKKKLGVISHCKVIFRRK